MSTDTRTPADALGQPIAVNDELLVVTAGVPGFDIGDRVVLGEVADRWVRVVIGANGELSPPVAGGHFIAITEEV